MSAQSDTTDTIKSLLDIVKTLKGFIDSMYEKFKNEKRI